ncbi:hypothetical protein BT69DRAFT_1319995 [Atractiella rhizophila]|nr:hypothetical protein BT69DRAFT_1319995 [Atractiella rhizophila]
MATAQKTRPSTDSKIITHSQSLAAVQTLLRAAFGCICYTRGIFDDDSFETEELPSSDPQLLKGGKEGKRRNSVRAKKLVRGKSKVGDQLLDYLEIGIGDALTRGYLQSMILAICTDPSRPLDIVECYQFNFAYSSTGQIDVELRNKMADLIVSSGTSTKSTAASRKKVSTITKGAVKDMVQNMIRRLPTSWIPAGRENDKFVFATRLLDDEPELLPCSALSTGHHSVKLTAHSIASRINRASPEDGEGVAQSPCWIWTSELSFGMRRDPLNHLQPNSQSEVQQEEIILKPLGIRMEGGEIRDVTTKIGGHLVAFPRDKRTEKKSWVSSRRMRGLS